MATTLNKVTVGNDFVLKIKVGLVQYGNNTVSWDYMDLTTCRNIVFNISCTKHNIDINLPFTIDSEDHSVISAIVRAELLHANSIYNFTISGLDANGYRWTYISPKQQSFLTTAVTEETSAAAYTELAFTAGMIMPLAAQGKDGHTPYIGENNNWWINGVDTGISAISNIEVLDNYSTTAEIETMLDSYYTKSETDNLLDNIEVDLTGYATENYVDNAINNIDIPEASGNTINYIKSNIYDTTGEGYYLDEYGNISSRIDNFTRHYIFDTGVELTNDTEIEIICSNSIGLPGVWYDWSYSVLGVYDPSTDKRVLMLAEEGGDNDIHMQITNNGMSVTYSLYPDYNKKLDSIHTYKISNSSGWIDGKNIISYDGQDISVLPNPVDWEDWMYNEGLSNMTIKCLPSTGNYYIYGLKIWKSGTLIRDYVPVKTDNGDGFHDNVSNTDIVSPEMKLETRCLDTYSTDAVQSITSSINNNVQGYVEIRVQQQAPTDCTDVINNILADTTPTTNITRWDQVISLWEVSHNAYYHYHGRGRYYDCDIDAYLDKDETTQHNIATYRFWHPIQEKYYAITIEYDYNDERGNLISCTYKAETISMPDLTPYATKNYVDTAIANIPSGSTPDLSNYVTNSSLSTTLADYVTDTDLSTELSDYVTNSSLSTELSDYVTNSSLSTELSDYVTSSDLQNNILSDYVTGTSLSTTLADYATKTYVDSAIANIPSGSTPDLSNYVTNSSLQTTLSSYATQSYVDMAISGSEGGYWCPLPAYNISNSVANTTQLYAPVYKVKIYNSLKINNTNIYIDNYTVQLDNSAFTDINGYAYIPTLTGTDQYITVTFDRSGTTPTVSITTSGLNDNVHYNYDPNTDSLDNYITVDTGEDQIGFYAIIDLTTLPYNTSNDIYDPTENFYKIEGVLFTPVNWSVNLNNKYISGTVRGFYSDTQVDRNMADIINLYVAAF